MSVRRLSAILATDVVDYSRLMAADESGTLQRLSALRRDVVDPALVRHGGRVVKLMGDGSLIEFPSAVSGVACAIEIQTTLFENAAPLRLRMGLNLGDVIIEGADLYGDGVNIAARLEAEAAPGGLCISDMVHQIVQPKLDTGFVDLGERRLKNIDRPVHAWYWAPEGCTTHPDQAAGAGSGASAPEAARTPSLAVLPFNNMSDDPEQEFFSDGISEDIITELSKTRTLIVLARNSSFIYKGKAVDIRDVGAEMGVDYVVEGSVRKAGQRIRVTAQLIEVEGGTHLWADRYDGTIEDIFDLQDDITRSIVATVTGRLDDVQAAGLVNRPTDSLTAYEHMLRGQGLLRRYSEEDFTAAIDAFEAAIAADPKLARAYAGLALARYHLWGGAYDRALLEGAIEAGQAGLRLDPHEPRLHLAMGPPTMFLGDHARAEYHFSRAMALNPNDDETLVEYGRFKLYNGKPLEGAELVRLAIRRNPFGANWYWNVLGRCLHTAGLYEEAMSAFGRIETPRFFTHAYLAACHAMLGDADSAAREVARTLEMQPDFSMPKLIGQLPYQREEDLDVFLEGFRRAGLPF